MNLTLKKIVLSPPWFQEAKKALAKKKCTLVVRETTAPLCSNTQPSANAQRLNPARHVTSSVALANAEHFTT
jgi:hypothetical protein